MSDEYPICKAVQETIVKYFDCDPTDYEGGTGTGAGGL